MNVQAYVTVSTDDIKEWQNNNMSEEWLTVSDSTDQFFTCLSHTNRIQVPDDGASK